MSWARRPAARWAAAALVGAALICAAAAWLTRSPPWLAESRLALTRWRASATSHYRLQVEETALRYLYLQGRCVQEVEVRDEAVLTVLSNSCPSAPQTVTTLFEQIQGSPGRPCDGPSCLCVLVREVRAEYDPQRGQPQRVTLRWTTEPNWLSPNYWRSTWQRQTPPDCSPGTSALDRTLVVRLTPLP